MPELIKLYWDSCMFYEVLGNEDVDAGKKAAMDELLAQNQKKENLIFTCNITYLEVLPDKLNEKNGNAERDFLALFDNVHFSEIELTTNIILRAREIRNHYYRPADIDGAGARMMDLGDALHLAAATIHKIPIFHTRDNKRRKGNVPLLSLYEMYQEDRICGQYALKIESPEDTQGRLNV